MSSTIGKNNSNLILDSVENSPWKGETFEQDNNVMGTRLTNLKTIIPTPQKEANEKYFSGGRKTYQFDLERYRYSIKTKKVHASI